MNSEFEQLCDKIDRLAELTQALRRENAELRISKATLMSENAELSKKIQSAYQRVAALLEKIPAPEQDKDAA